MFDVLRLCVFSQHAQAQCFRTKFADEGDSRLFDFIESRLPGGSELLTVKFLCSAEEVHVSKPKITTVIITRIILCALMGRVSSLVSDESVRI